MILIIGGNSQGKLAFAQQSFALPAQAVAQGAHCPLGEAFSAPALNHLHLWVDRMLHAGLDPDAAAAQGVARNPGIILLCDELGCGIVPMDAHSRALRERVGRLCCTLAEQAQAVYRVYCGIATQLKGSA